ncbi:hypothetical protein [Adhaeribacter aquaticus]|uniref:hypothetical protein n=1 Tax=Adhaeribacter aquaticus TaxID=299567 RepID=UPI0012F923A4|nr:hypothetical protein [Adhaeribacter aquaticus]
MPVYYNSGGRGGKQENKRQKQHLLVDMQGFLLAVKVSLAGVTDRQGAQVVLVEQTDYNEVRLNKYMQLVAWGKLIK